MPSECVIGVDLGGTKLLAGTVHEGLEVHHRAQRRAPDSDQGALLDALVETVQELREVSELDVAAVGFGIPALMDRDSGVALSAVHLPIADIAFADVMAERIGLPVVVDNDANAAMLAEHRWGAAKGSRHAAMLTIGTGIGGGLVLDGKLYRGSRGSGAEIGHIVVDPDGPPCTGVCPNNGCLETLASGTALGREGARVAGASPDTGLGRALASGREITGSLVTELAHDGDPAARDVVALIGTYLGIGLTSLVNLLEPETIVIGGGVIAAGELLIEPARRVVAERALPPARAHVEIVQASFGVESGMLGAAAMAWDSVPGRAAA